MKKLGVILVVAAVVIGCVLAAGCTNNTSTPSTPSTSVTIPADLSKVNPALTVDVVKTGNSIYNIGDTFTITLPSDQLTGFSWKDYTEELGDGLKVTVSSGKTTTVETSTSTNKGTVSALGQTGSQTFTYTAEKEGNQVIGIGYEKGDELLHLYADVMIVKKSDNDHSHGEFTYSGDYTPQVGKVALITAQGNPTTGYELYVDKDEVAKAGLTVQESYEADNTGLLGSGGTYKWYVTAKQPNMYVLNVYEKDARDGSSTLKFFVPLTFTLEA